MNHLLEKVDSYKHVIWDWNGTLLNDTHLTVEAACVLLRNHNLPEITVEDYKRVFRFPIRDYYISLGFDFNKTPFEVLCDQFVHEYNVVRVKSATLFHGVKELLPEIKRTKKQSILSAAEQNHLNEIVTYFDIHHHFDHICGIQDHYAASKIKRGEELISYTDISPQETILIGDTDHDLEVGRALGVQVLLIADGHQSFDRLSAIHSNVLSTRFLSDR